MSSLQVEVLLTDDDRRAIAQEITRSILTEIRQGGEPFYTLEALAAKTNLSLTTWQRVRTNYPGYFTSLAGVPIIRASALDEFLSLHEGTEIATRSMSEQTKQELAARRMAKASGQ